MFIVAPFMPKIVRTMGKKNGYIAEGRLPIIAGIGISWSLPSVPAVPVVFFASMGVALAAVNVLMFRAGGRHRRVRRADDRCTDREHHVRAVLLHTQAGPRGRR